MSPRAAWRLEGAGFTQVYDYVAGKMDWLAADLPFEGSAQLVGQFTRRRVPTIGEHDRASAALQRLGESGFGPVIALNSAGVVVGTLRREDMERSAGAGVAEVLRFGVSTVRPSEQVSELVHRMRHGRVSRVVVTRSDGTLVGLFFSEDVETVEPDD